MSQGAPELSECRYCGESFTAAGIQNHETWCDQNPHPGISPAQQKELGLTDQNEGRDTDTDTDTHQDVGSGGGALPSRTTLQGSGKVTGSVTAMADGSTEEVPVECPLCGSDDTMASADARREYESETKEPIAGVVLAFQLSERYCNDCFALWGDEMPEPVPLDEAVGATEGGAA